MTIEDTGSGASEDPGKPCEDRFLSILCQINIDSCISNAVYMNRHCCATCTAYLATATFTTTTENSLCKDTAASCDIYSRIGYCEDNIDLMLKMCCRTCRLDHLFKGN